MAGEAAVQSQRRYPFRQMGRAARTYVREAGKPRRPDGVEVAHDQIDARVAGDDVAKLPAVASLPMIEVDVRDLHSGDLEDERDPPPSPSRSRRAQIPLQSWRQVQNCDRFERLGAPRRKPVRPAWHDMADVAPAGSLEAVDHGRRFLKQQEVGSMFVEKAQNILQPRSTAMQQVPADEFHSGVGVPRRNGRRELPAPG